MEEQSPKQPAPKEPVPIRWEDPRFPPAIEAARKACGVSHHEDDAMCATMHDKSASGPSYCLTNRWYVRCVPEEGRLALATRTWCATPEPRPSHA